MRGKYVSDNENGCGRPPQILWKRREMAEARRTQVGGDERCSVNCGDFPRRIDAVCECASAFLFLWEFPRGIDFVCALHKEERRDVRDEERGPDGNEEAQGAPD